jgi:hypothetical protein
MIGKPYLGLRRCEATVRVLFGTGYRRCSNPARSRIGDVLLCVNHSKGEAVKVTIEFEQSVLDGIEAAKLVLAVRRAIDTKAGGFGASGPIVDDDGTVVGRWKAEHTKKRKAA